MKHEDVENNFGQFLKQVHFYRIPNTTVTICAVTLDNGFTLIGKSACVYENSFNQELGEELAAQDALNQLGPFIGFRECDKKNGDF